MIYRIILLLYFCLISNQIGFTQDFDAMVKKCWENNAQLKSKTFELQQAEYALAEAKSMFGPTIGFNTQYTLASGGRLIEFPIGDIVNPVYSTLNALTQSNNFGRLENENINFLPNNFYDARFRIQQPIYYPELQIQKSLKLEQIKLKELEIKAFKRLLSKEVMQAYVQFKSSLKVIQIYSNADTLLRETARVTDRMIKNGVALPTAAYRINGELAGLENQKTEAEANSKNALEYLKYLIGDPQFSITEPMNLSEELPVRIDNQISIREELQQIDQGIKMNQLAIKKEDQFYLPKVGIGLDVGSQDFDFGWAPYVLFGLNIDINLYDAKRHKHRKAQVNSGILSLQSQRVEAENQFQLQSEMAETRLRSAVVQANNFGPRKEAAEKLYRDVLLKYKEGSAGYLEIVDAQKNLTSITLEKSLSIDMAWLRWIEYLYATAAYEIE